MSTKVLIFFCIAIIAGVLGFSGIIASEISILAELVFFVVLILLVASANSARHLATDCENTDEPITTTPATFQQS